MAVTGRTIFMGCTHSYIVVLSGQLPHQSTAYLSTAYYNDLHVFSSRAPGERLSSSVSFACHTEKTDQKSEPDS